MGGAGKTDNHNLAAKLALRRTMLRDFKPDGPLSVCDCFSGGEILWTRLRAEFAIAEYLALDVKPKRGRLKLDSLRYLQNQKWRHNVIDLDAYGSPWAHWLEVVKRKIPCLVFLTVGNSIWKRQPKMALAEIGIHFAIPPAIEDQLVDLILHHCLAAPLESGGGLGIGRAMEAENLGGSARYFGIRLETKPTAKYAKHAKADPPPKTTTIPPAAANQSGS